PSSRPARVSNVSRWCWFSTAVMPAADPSARVRAGGFAAFAGFFFPALCDMPLLVPDRVGRTGGVGTALGSTRSAARSLRPIPQSRWRFWAIPSVDCNQKPAPDSATDPSETTAGRPKGLIGKLGHSGTWAYARGGARPPAGEAGPAHRIPAA